MELLKCSTEYKLDFGDNTTGTGVAPTHVYNASGTYTITLTVTDNIKSKLALFRILEFCKDSEYYQQKNKILTRA